MRKQTKLVAVLSAAALLAVGASMTSFAAEKGWAEENGAWVFYNNDGELATTEWKKSGNNWFWLNEDGVMATDTIVEDGTNYYYVNANGAMVTNSWVAVEPGEDADEYAPDHYWYYFGANGKAYKASDSSTKDIVIKTINGKKYGFNNQGKMLYGFVREDGQMNQDSEPFMDAMYYFGDYNDGAMHTDWLAYTDGSDNSSTLTGKEYADQDIMYFYFNASNGKMVKATQNQTTGEIKLATKTVRGQKYAFDENGVMVYDWQNPASPSNNASKSNYFSSEEDGHLRKKTWIYAVPDEFMGDGSDYEDGTNRWFYASSNGTTYKSAIKKIGGKSYLFDEDGIMKSGLQWVKVNGTKNDVDILAVDPETKANVLAGQNGYELYYFGSDEEKDGSMKTGKNLKIELSDDGETYTFGFKTTGIAYDYNRTTGTKLEGLTDNKIYINGLLIKADADQKYVYTADATDFNLADSKEYVVGTSGVVVKPGKYVEDGDENWYAVIGKDYGATLKKGDVVKVPAGDWAREEARCWVTQGKAGSVQVRTNGSEYYECK